MAEISKTADQALTVLLSLIDDSPLTAAEVSRTLGMNRTIAQRLLTTLHQRGFVTRSTNGYSPGAILVRIAARVEPELRAIATQRMEELCAVTGETVVMHIPDGGRAVVLEQHVGRGHVVRVEHEIGTRHDLGTGASGRAILAYLPAADVTRSSRKSSDPEALLTSLNKVRESGYAVSHDELQEGVHGLAVPLLDRTGSVIASLAIIVPTARAETLLDHLDALQTTVKEVSQALAGE